MHDTVLSVDLGVSFIQISFGSLKTSMGKPYQSVTAYWMHEADRDGSFKRLFTFAKKTRWETSMSTKYQVLWEVFISASVLRVSGWDRDW